MPVCAEVHHTQNDLSAVYFHHLSNYNEQLKRHEGITSAVCSHLTSSHMINITFV